MGLSACKNSPAFTEKMDFGTLFHIGPEEPENIPANFKGYLYHEYLALADFEAQSKNRKNDARFFKKRAYEALGDAPLAPLSPDLDSLPEHSRSDIAFGREKLATLMKSKGDLSRLEKKEEYLLAFLQTRFDCWVRHSKIFKSPKAYIGCKDQFYKAMLTLGNKDLKQYSTSIYFETNSIALSLAAKDQIKDLSGRFRHGDSWHFILKGYTDSAGDKFKNKTLSMRRAVAIKNALGQHGINLDNITILAGGEITQDEAHNENPRNPENRRVDVFLEPMIAEFTDLDDSPQIGGIPGWSHGSKDY